jgi:hypothetical protein
MKGARTQQEPQPESQYEEQLGADYGELLKARHRAYTGSLVLFSVSFTVALLTVLTVNGTLTPVLHSLVSLLF